MLNAICTKLPRVTTTPLIKNYNAFNSIKLFRQVNTFKNNARENISDEEPKNVKMPLLYHTIAAISLLLFGTAFGFLTVPLYRLFCQQTGFGGTVKEKTSMIDIEPQEGKFVTVQFDRMVHPSLPWEFIPQQEQITVF